MDKVVESAAVAVSDLGDGASIAVGGFGLCGVPFTLIDAVYDSGASELSIVSNNCGTIGRGLGRLLGSGRIARAMGSYVGENKELARRYLGGEIELELMPQGTLAEKLRAGGCGIPAFFTPAGVGTLVAEGGLPWRYDGNGGVEVASPPKEVREFGGREYVLEESVTTDFALVRAVRGDRHGNLVFARSARNFNPLCAMAARIAVAEVEELVDFIDPDEVQLPGIFVQRVVALTPEQVAAKPIEKRTVTG